MNQITKSTNHSQRNYGIDLLRLVAAFYVIIMHTLHQGGIYEATAAYSYQAQVCRALSLLSHCAVNIFGIISGYVGYREPLKKFSVSGYLSIWLTVVFYCLLSALFYGFTQPGSVTGRDLMNVFTPVTGNLLWYFSAFTLVHFLSPFLNKILYHSSEKELKQLFALCCLFTTVEFLGSSFGMRGGFAAQWLLLLYLVGGIMKKAGIGSRLSSPAAVFLLLVLDFLFYFLGLKWTELPLFGLTLSLDFKRTYINPFYLAAAILHVILFARLRFPGFLQKVIAFAAPAAFSVYIANTNPYFWDNFMKDRFVSWAASSPAGILARTLLFSLGFVLAVIIIDFFRRQLFRVLGVNTWANKLSAFFQKEKAS